MPYAIILRGAGHRQSKPLGYAIAVFRIGLEKVPAYQKFIVDRALFYNKKVFLATQFLKTMETSPIPTIAEVVDLYNTFKMGVYGIQLSEETAIGAHVDQCLAIIQRVLQEIIHELKD